jgi:hypothetical protein
MYGRYGIRVANAYKKFNFFIYLVAYRFLYVEQKFQTRFMVRKSMVEATLGV